MPLLAVFVMGWAFGGLLAVFFVALPYREAFLKARTELDQLRRCGRFLTPKEMEAIKKGRQEHEEGSNN